MRSVYEIADIRQLTSDNSLIVKEGDFAVLYLCTKEEKQRIGTVEVKLAFPFEKTDGFIVLFDEKGQDAGLIEDLNTRTPEEQATLREEIGRRYYMPIITGIVKVSERFNSSTWEVRTAEGALRFSVKDTNHSLIHLGNRLIITDADGNRYDIPDVTALPKKDRRKLDIYLY